MNWGLCQPALNIQTRQKFPLRSKQYFPVSFSFDSEPVVEIFFSIFSISLFYAAVLKGDTFYATLGDIFSTTHNSQRCCKWSLYVQYICYMKWPLCIRNKTTKRRVPRCSIRVWKDDKLLTGLALPNSAFLCSNRWRNGFRMIALSQHSVSATRPVLVFSCLLCKSIKEVTCYATILRHYSIRSVQPVI